MTLREDRANRSAEISRSLRPNRPILTEKEWDLLHGWCEGLPTKQIADLARVHRQTYYSAQKTLFAKLGNCRTDAQAMLHAIRLGLIHPEDWAPDDSTETSFPDSTPKNGVCSNGTCPRREEQLKETGGVW